ncbi:MAG TPA: hypothetical protein PLV19_11310, partial [Nitrosomonas sp.]|nr:hypothetical protein [Nitrosomonas sp.]HRB46602.1 hypothetical protein [Nitrosomonas sp.]HRB78294.1 hypothetical protein [Nitrosomonas sp.]
QTRNGEDLIWTPSDTELLILPIYLYGLPGSDSGVTLNTTQLKALSDTSNKLIVNGNHGNYVHITDDGWQDKGIYNGMHTYTNADAQLLVGVNVMVEFV